MKTIAVMILSIMTAFICRCGIPPSAGGGTSDTGNAKIAAIIYSTKGERAANASVKICPAGYHSAVGSDSCEKRKAFVKYAVTNDTGYFGIDTIECGEYSIEVNDGIAWAVLLQVSVSPQVDSTVMIEDTLKPYATIEGNAGKTEDTTLERYFVIYGLERRIPVGCNGAFLLDDLPAGTFHCRVVSTEPTWTSLDFKEVRASSGEKTMIIAPDTGDTAGPADSIHRAEILLNTSSSGAGVASPVYGFPVLVRLTGDNFRFVEASPDGSDIRFVNNDGTPLPFAFESWDALRHTAAVWVLLDTVHGNSDTQSFQMLWGKTATVPRANARPVFDTAGGFLACYHLNGTPDDATPHSFNGVDSGSVDAANGIIGRARSFNGISQFISLGDLPDRPRGTISCWFRPKAAFNSSSSKTQGIWGKKDNDDTNFSLSLSGTDFFISNDIKTYGKLVSKMEHTRVGYYLSSTTASFNAGQWYFAAWSWGDGGDSLYVNGVLEASTPNNITLSGNASEEIGRNQFDYNNVPAGGPRYFNGTIDEFRIDNTCRSAAWIKLCYMNQRSDDKLVTVRRVE